MTKAMHLVAGKGGGSTMVEALLTLANIPFTREELDWTDVYATAARLKEINPAGHVPALVLPSGEVVTESLALTLLIDEWTPEAKLAPKPGDPKRAKYLRLQAMICASIYPMWTFDDRPERYVGEDEAARKMLRRRTEKRRKDLWRILDGLVEAKPWALGRNFSTVDVFIGIMTRWRPRREWFEKHCPKLYSIATRVDALPALKPVFARNFG